MNIKYAKHRLSRRMKFRGLDISIETDKGESRHWYDPHTKEKGSTMMTHPYGYIRLTEGVDGDHVDCYVGPNENAKNVYIVNQRKKPPLPTRKEWRYFDEQKCMLGFNNAEEAKNAYLKNFNDARFFGSMIEISFEEFKTKVLKTLHNPKRVLKTAKIASMPMSHLNTAYRLGSLQALDLFEKNAGLKDWFVKNYTRRGQDALRRTALGRAAPAEAEAAATASTVRPMTPAASAEATAAEQAATQAATAERAAAEAAKPRDWSGTLLPLGLGAAGAAGTLGGYHLGQQHEKEKGWF